MYTIYDIENEKTHECAVIFRFNGQKMTVDSGAEMKTTEISREDLEHLVDWLRINLEKMNRDKWDAEHVRACNCVNVANE